ncbi:MAG: aromatic ring hydroxylase [candidate division Zixibacteria bacterium RBG_16_48_11]|nr:MAG: aromatic ring hydroxylase [candidate division Zixibacteria bacterium RBG_16_48_11]
MPVTVEQVYEALKECYDPEIPINIVDLGLIYDVQVKESKVDVKMTLTAPGCGMGQYIAGQAQSKIMELDGVEEANVELVWEPLWDPSLITPEGKKMIGWE